MTDLRRNLLWIDCSGGAVVGAAVLILSGWLSEWYQLPRSLVLFMGAVNLAYASFSFSLAVRAKRPIGLIRLLALANMAWALFFCWPVAFAYRDTASIWALVHLVGEGIYVGCLGYLEWRWRTFLREA